MVCVWIWMNLISCGFSQLTRGLWQKQPLKLQLLNPQHQRLPWECLWLQEICGSELGWSGKVTTDSPATPGKGGKCGSQKQIALLPNTGSTSYHACHLLPFARPATPHIAPFFLSCLFFSCSYLFVCTVYYYIYIISLSLSLSLSYLSTFPLCWTTWQTLTYSQQQHCGVSISGIGPGATFPSRENPEHSTVEPAEPWSPWKFWNPWNRWSPWSQRKLWNPSTCGTRGRLPVVLLNAPLRIKQQWFCLMYRCGSTIIPSSLHLVFVTLSPIILSSCLSSAFLPPSCLPLSWLPSFCRPSYCPPLSLHLVSPQLVSHSFVAQHSFPLSSFHLVSHNPFVLPLITLYLVTLCPIILSPIIPASPSTESSWVESLEAGRYNVLVPHHFVSHHALIWSSRSFSLHLASLHLASHRIVPPSSLHVVSLHLVSFFMSPIHVSLIITFHILSLSVYLTYHHPFILSPFTLPRSVLSPVICSSCLSLSLHLVSHYPFILSLIIPSSCHVILSLPMFFWPCAECGQKLFDFFCCWVVKLGYFTEEKLPTGSVENLSQERPKGPFQRCAQSGTGWGGQLMVARLCFPQEWCKKIGIIWAAELEKSKHNFLV